MQAAEGAGEVGELSEALRAEIEEKMERETVRFYSDLGDAGAVFLSEKLRGNTIVEELFLTSSEIGAVGARALAEVLAENNTTLKHLSLDSNSLGDDGAEAMALMLRKNTTLEGLDLGHCGVGRRGARALGEALKENCTLKGIGLSDNCFGDDGAHALAYSLRWNESLGKLNLESCRLTDVGASYLLAALRESNSTVTVLWLGGNHLSDYDIKDPILKLLEKNMAVRPATAERRARCLLFCCLKLAPTAHEHVVPSIGAVPVPVMQLVVEHAGKLHVAKRFEHGNAVAGYSSAGVHARSSSSSPEDLETATSRRR